jgi:hypothetical protein
MADKKISALTTTTTPLAGTEVLPIVQSSSTKKVSVSDLTAGRTVLAEQLSVGGTASSWSGFKAVDISNSGAVAAFPGFGLLLARNIYYDGSNYRYKINGTAAYLEINSNGKLEFLSAASGTAADVIPSFTSRFEVEENTGNVYAKTGSFIVGTAGKGIDFSATTEGSGTMTSELLADYEEGTWTPEFDSPGATFTYNAAQTGGIYTRVGRVVTLSAVISITAKSGGTTGNPLTFGNFPFSPINADFGGAGPAFTITCLSYTITVPVGYEIWTAGVKNGNGILPLYASTLGAGFRMFEYGDISGTAQIQFSATYQTS